MTNKLGFLGDMELEDRMKDMDDRELMEFTARQVYDVCNRVGSDERRITLLENRSNKVMGIVGGAGTFIGAIITGIISYFLND